MNKNIITLAGFVLVAIIGYQAYLLNKSSDTPLFETKKNQPNITVNIEKKSIEKEVRELNQPKSNLTPNQPNVQNQIDPKEIFDEELIKKDLGKLFSDIFGNPKLQEGIKEGMKEMEQQLKQGLKEMEKGFGDLSGELNKLSKDDPFFKDLLDGLAGGLASTNRLQFTDRGSDYYLKLNIPGGSESNIDIQTKANLLTLTITQKVIQDKQSKNSTMHSESMRKNQNVLLIPNDAFIDKLETKYDNGVLEITVPKIDKVKS
jgi:HSP20 family protein